MDNHFDNSEYVVTSYEDGVTIYTECEDDEAFAIVLDMGFDDGECV
jgi:hypothetical protein